MTTKKYEFGGQQKCPNLVMVTQRCTFVKTHRILHIKAVSFTLCQVYLNIPQ